MKNYIYLALLLFMTACSQQAVFEKYEEIPNENWSRYQVIEFTANIPDSGLYNVQLCVRHTTDYEMANLWCFVSTRSHAQTQLYDTINVKIAEPDGRWLGKGNAIRIVQQNINKNPVTLPKGNVIFRIEQGMRLEEMPGIKDIGLRIEKRSH